MQYTEEQIIRANQTDLVSFLNAQGEQLVKSGREYRWKKHDSVTVSGNRWYRHSQSKGGYPVDFVMEFYYATFPEAVKMLIGEEGEGRQKSCPAPSKDFRLPEKNEDNEMIVKYLTESRELEKNLVMEWIVRGDIYEEKKHHNVVFVGRDADGIPRYAHCRGTGEIKYRGDVAGSDKSFGFCYRGTDNQLFVFEAAIDLLSFIQLFPKDWKKRSYLSLSGVSSMALMAFLSEEGKATETKLERGAKLIRELLADKKEISIRELDEKAKEQGISGRTMRDVRSRMKNELEYQVNEKQENSIRLKE